MCGSNARRIISIEHFVKKLFHFEVGQCNCTLGHFTQVLKNKKLVLLHQSGTPERPPLSKILDFGRGVFGFLYTSFGQNLDFPKMKGVFSRGVFLVKGTDRSMWDFV